MLVSDWVHTAVRNYYGRYKSTGDFICGRSRQWFEGSSTSLGMFKMDVHNDRIIQFLRFIKENPNKDIPTLWKSWNKRFMWFEMVRDLERHGIATSLESFNDDSFGCLEKSTLTSQTLKALVRTLIKVHKLVRQLKGQLKRYPTAKETLQYWMQLQDGLPSRKQLASMYQIIDAYLEVFKHASAIPISQLVDDDDNEEYTIDKFSLSSVWR